MLNYLWAGMILLSLTYAVGVDLVGGGYPTAATLAIDGDAVTMIDGEPVTATLTRDGEVVRVAGEFAEPWATMAEHYDAEAPALAGTLQGDVLSLPAVRLPRLTRVTRAAFGAARTGVDLALGLIGLLALWLGLVKIGEVAGMIDHLVRFVRPLLRPLFPSLRPDSPAFAMIALNVTANVLGLGNAATPLGLKAMEELQKENPSADTATDPMVMLLAINTASVTLVPPATLIAVMGVEAGRLTLPIIGVTGLSLVVAVTAVFLLGRLPMFRRTRPVAEGGAA